MAYYARPNSSKGDSMTDVGALALIGDYDCASHIRACQRADGRMYRHPDFYTKHVGCGVGNHGCDSHECTMSRDHTIALCNYSLFSQDLTPLRRFFWYCIRHFGRMGPGTMGQSMQNLNTLACMLLALGGFGYVIGLVLALISLPFLYLSGIKLEVGYRTIMVSEIILIYWLTMPKLFKPLLTPVAKAVYLRQPANCYYKLVYFLCANINTYEIVSENDTFMHKQVDGLDDSWVWTNPCDGRKGTGVDVAYLYALISRYK